MPPTMTASIRAATTRRPNTAVGSVCATGYAMAPVLPPAFGGIRVIGRGGATDSLPLHVRGPRSRAVRQDRQPLQAARLRVPERRDLRRLPEHLRLRAARRADAAQREERLVALDGAARATTSSAWMPRCSARRPSGRPPATWRTSPTRSSTARRARSASASTSWTTRPPARAAGRRTASPRRASSTSCSRPTPARSRGRATRSSCGPRRRRGCSSTSRTCSRRSRKKPPFGIAQVGKSFRNEITPGNFVFRTREFEQMEMEFFVPPAESQQWYEYWCQQRYDWYIEHGIPTDMLRLRPHAADELSHYSSGTSDVEFLFPWGFDELEGIANRGDFDLTAHANASGERLRVLRPDHQRALRAARHRAGGRGHAHDDGVPAWPPTPRRRSTARPARCCACTTGSLRIRWRCSRSSKKDTLTPVAQEVFQLLAPHFMCDYDETPGHRPALPPPGRGGHAVLPHGRLRDLGGPFGHGA